METNWRFSNIESQESQDNSNQDNTATKINKLIKIILLIFTIVLIFSFKSSKKTKIDDENKNSNQNEKIKNIKFENKGIKKAKESFQQFIYKDNIDSSKNLPYNIFIPEFISEGEKLPLMIFINDANVIGNKLASFIEPLGSNIWATETWQKNHKCFVLVPCYNELIIDDSNEYIKSSYIDITIHLIGFIKSKYINIDENRIYITGGGTGGSATLYMISNYPYIFAAGLIVGGKWRIDEIKGLVNSTFTFVSSFEDKKYYNSQKEIKNYLNYNEIKINFGSINSINLKENHDLINIYIYNMFNLGYRRNFITFTNADNNYNQQEDKYNYVYEFNSILEWLFSQKIKIYDEYYKSKDGKLIQTKFCAQADKNNICIKCIDGYYLTKDKTACTLEKNCEKGDKTLGLCLECLNNYYLDIKQKKCFSNKEKIEYNYCKQINEGICTLCEKYFYLDLNNKCTTTENCENSQNSKCIKCIKGFYLGIDHMCTNIENCIYSRNGECTECQDGFYYDKINKKCKRWKDDFLKNCKTNNLFNEKKCESCKDGFYLDRKENLCITNKEKNNFYKCQISNDNGKECAFCVKEYYLGRIDKKCSLIYGCLQSKDEDFCLECDKDFCLDNFGYCKNNYDIKEIDKKFFFRCNKVNENGSGCSKCEKDYLVINKNGLCYDKTHCEIFEKENCKKCKKENLDGYYSYCLNKEFGCIDTFQKNCLRCDDILNIDTCTECENGYELDKDGNCIKV